MAETVEKNKITKRLLKRVDRLNRIYEETLMEIYYLADTFSKLSGVYRIDVDHYYLKNRKIIMRYGSMKIELYDSNKDRDDKYFEIVNALRELVDLYGKRIIVLRTEISTIYIFDDEIRKVFCQKINCDSIKT